MAIPLRICTSHEMRDLDDLAINDFEISSQILMENAGRAAVQVLFDHFPSAGRDTEIIVLAGKGNNAGDAFVMARRLICLERRVRIFHLVPEDQYKGTTKTNFEILKRLRAKMVGLDNSNMLHEFFEQSTEKYTVIDGILGTGLKGPLQGVFHDVVELINHQRNVTGVFALDIPSGVSGDSGVVLGTSVQADVTVSFGFPKTGHFLPPGASRRGKLVNVDISLPPQFRKEGNKFLLMKSPMANLLNDRDRYGHKNSFGHAFLIGGSRGRLGAITMASRACHKMGTGLVTVATWPDSSEILMTKLPDETMAVEVPIETVNSAELSSMMADYTSIVIGPGLGRRPEGRLVMEGLLQSYRGPIVIDADALNLISEFQLHDLVLARNAPTVLTPHPGEMARLLVRDKNDIVDNPLEAVKEAVAKTHAVVVLKGAATIIGSTDEVYYFNHYPNDGMATAGTGDVLAGMIGGLVGQKMDCFEATKLGVYLHSLAGAFAAKNQGHRAMTAGDIIENIGQAFEDLRSTHDPSFPEQGRATLL